MEIRKYTFDYSPSLIEYEGNYIRINFDVEQIELANGTDSNEIKNATRMAYAAHVVRIGQPVERGKVIDAIFTSVSTKIFIFADVRFKIMKKKTIWTIAIIMGFSFNGLPAILMVLNHSSFSDSLPSQTYTVSL